jgi:hypothetical protein
VRPHDPQPIRPPPLQPGQATRLGHRAPEESLPLPPQLRQVTSFAPPQSSQRSHPLPSQLPQVRRRWPEHPGQTIRPLPRHAGQEN